uniref:Uncharacterized protein n=1 Tax=Brassica oleracea var. oleracea TaxID=109376 RepID=A0A0D3CBG6_BRAOL
MRLHFVSHCCMPFLILGTRNSFHVSGWFIRIHFLCNLKCITHHIIKTIALWWLDINPSWSILRDATLRSIRRLSLRRLQLNFFYTLLLIFCVFLHIDHVMIILQLHLFISATFLCFRTRP